MADEDMAWVAFCEHGKIRAASMDDSLTTQHCLRDLREFKRWAARVDRISGVMVRAGDWNCDPCDEKRKRRKRS